MSYRTMMKHKAVILELTEGQTNGIVTHLWTTKKYPAGHESAGQDIVIPLFLDLGFIRRGKDPIWTQEAGRASDRSGVAFVLTDAPVASGNRLRMTKGPSGTFSIEGAVDEAWRPEDKHHIELGVVEVARSISNAQQP